eukprot:GFYU01009116.1.p1 GENE.GFYU01009116.1~~GFYU01009116.1.p1  ORF type:complete len:599 (-),score=184.01 GFYU01009116.1:22-1722(-)
MATTERVFHVGQRIAAGTGFRGTVKYVGSVKPSKPEQEGLWLGVEWDDVERGKHDGVHNGERYFQTTHPTSGSFLRPDKALPGTTFVEALVTKYSKQENAEEEAKELFVYSVRDKPMSVDFVGADKAKARQSQLTRLPEASVRGENVDSAGGDDEVAGTVPALTLVDLSRTLMSSWEEVGKICVQLTQLGTVNVAYNIMSPLTASPSFGPAPQLKVLVLNHTGVDWQQMKYLAPCFPSLEEIHLVNNGLDTFCEEGDALVTEYPHLKVLNLEDCKVTWKEISRFSQHKNLDRIILAGNLVEEVVYDAASNAFPALQHLSLESTKVSSWQSVDQLNHFPQLVDVRLQKISLFDDIPANVSRIEVIGRVAKLRSYNGSEIRERERADCDKLYLKQCLNNELSDEERHKAHPRFKELLEKYGQPIMAKGDDGVTKLATEMLSLTIETRVGNFAAPTVKRCPSSMTIQQLKLLCGRIARTDPSDIQVMYRADTNSMPENMDDDTKQLSFYGVFDGGIIVVEEYNEQQQNASAAAQEQLLERQMKEAEERRELQNKQISAEKAAAAAAHQL